MSIKSLPKKMGNDLKADANTIFHALDKFASFGILHKPLLANGGHNKTEKDVILSFFKNPYSDTLYQILDEYFKNTPPS